ncbi:MAG: hypothetical protein KC609_11880 [Myxococcales bacterium]|nr:hypothetical protein [Myxococcales bacterium]
MHRFSQSLPAMLVVGVTIVLVSASIGGCRRGDVSTKQSKPKPRNVLRIDESNHKLVYLYRDPESGSYKRVRRISEIPQAARRRVLVSNPLSADVPPPGKLIVADLSGKPGADGYPYAIVSEEEHHRRVAPRPSLEKRPRLVMYSTSTCGVCRNARAYLKSKNVKFREVVLDRDAGAMTRLAKRAKELDDRGDLNSVPIFDIKGRLIRGFNRGQIDLLLGIH